MIDREQMLAGIRDNLRENGQRVTELADALEDNEQSFTSVLDALSMLNAELWGTCVGLGRLSVAHDIRAGSYPALYEEASCS